MSCIRTCKWPADLYVVDYKFRNKHYFPSSPTRDNAMQLAHIPCIATCLISMGFVWHHDKKKMEELKSLLDEKSQEKKDE